MLMIRLMMMMMMMMTMMMLVTDAAVIMTVSVVDFLIAVWMMMMMIAMTFLLMRSLLAQRGDYHLLVGHGVGASLRIRRRDDRRHETVGAPLRNDHVQLGVARRHDPQALLGEGVTLEHAVRAAAAVGARLELGEVVGKLQCS